MKTINITPVKSYPNLNLNKFTIYKENSNKSGIYRLNNLITNECYIGSSINLKKRLYCYFSIEYLRKMTIKGKSKIANALLKDGHSKFSLDILEYCELSILRSREQFYFDKLKPEYNILKIAGSTIRKKCSPETLAKTGNAIKSRRKKINPLLASPNSYNKYRK